MLQRLKDLFDAAVRDASASDGECAERARRRAAAALLAEMVRADREVSDAEREVVARALTGAFELPRTEVDALVALGESEADRATSLYEFTSLVNAHFSHEEKVRFVEQLWRVAYADGELEKHEAHLVRKVAGLLHLRHREYVSAKLRAASDAPQRGDAED